MLALTWRVPAKASIGKATEMSADLQTRQYDLVKTGFGLMEFSESDHLQMKNYILAI